MFYDKEFATIDEISREVKGYVRYYNKERIQLRLKRLSPIQYRLQSFN